MFAAYAVNEWVALSCLGAMAAVLLVALGFLLVGLFDARSLVRREFFAYFLSPIAYVVMVVFLAVTGHLFYLTMEQLTAAGPKGVEFPMQLMLGDERFWLVFLFIPPLLTMRLFAEERGAGTLEMLMTTPLRDWQVVMSKYVACFGFYLVMWLPTLVYLPVLLDLGMPVYQESFTPYSIALVVGLGLIVVSILLALLPGGTSMRLTAVALLVAGIAAVAVGGYQHYFVEVKAGTPALFTVPTGIDPMPVLASYVGLILAGAMFLALGLLVSSLVRSQMVAALLSLVLCLAFIVVGFWRPEMDAGSTLYQVLMFFSVPLHFSRDFSRGLIDTRHLILYGSVAVFALFLTVRSLESRRWR